MWLSVCLAKARGHWSVENELHWCLDMSFGDDASQVRAGHGAENLSVLKRMALNLLKQDTSLKASIRAKRKAGGWDNGYLVKLLNNINKLSA